MDILVTGASGYIGQRLVQVLTGRGDAVHALCRKAGRYTPATAGLTVFPGDLLDPASIERAMAGCDRVLHVAGYAKNWARDPRDFYDVNVQGTTNVLRAALTLGIKKVVYTSSAMTLGPSHGSPLDEQSVRTAPLLTDYENSKVRAEQVVLSFAGQGLDAVIVSPTRVYGPGPMTEGNSLTRMLKLYLEGRWRIIPGDGRALGNYAFVDDVVSGHLLAMEGGTPGGRYILGGENVSYDTLFGLFRQVSQRRRWLVHVAGTLLLAVSELEERRARWLAGYPAVTPGWMKALLGDAACSSAKAECELGYHVTPLEEGLRRTMDWLISQTEECGRTS